MMNGREGVLLHRLVKLPWILVFAVSLWAEGDVRHSRESFAGSGGKLAVDVYTPEGRAVPAAVIFLCGSGGIESSHFPVRPQAQLLASSGRVVYVPHYLDLTKGGAREPKSHYRQWAQAVLDLAVSIQSEKGIAMKQIAVVGYSLGGSVALSVGVLNPDFAGIVVWSGSLPDAYVDAQRMPPLLILHGGQDTVIPEFNARQLNSLCSMRSFRCTLSIYPNEGHEFSSTARKRVDIEIEHFLDNVLGR